MDLAINNLQRLICHKTQPNQTISSFTMHFCNKCFSTHNLILSVILAFIPFLSYAKDLHTAVWFQTNNYNL